MRAVVVCFGLCVALAGCASDETEGFSVPGSEAVGQSTSFVTGATTPGTWTPMVHAAPSVVGTLELLTDGTVLLTDGLTNWYKLTPDVNGSYVNGTWTQVASSHLSRLFMPSTMLKDGRYLIAGGEYVSGYDHATVDIYDAVADAWTAGPDMPSTIGDTAASSLADGRFLSSSNSTPNTYIFDPVANSWTSAGLIGTGGSGDEKGWTLLQNGTVLDAFDTASRYDPASNTWTATGALPPSAPLVAGGEIGPMSLLHSGKVIQFGAAVAPAIGHTAIYDPATNGWTQGPDAPDGLQFADSSASVLVNGNVLCSTTQFLSGGAVAAMWEYNPNVPAGPSSFTKVADGTSAFPGSANPLLEPITLPLPNGQVLVAQEPRATAPAFSIYTPAGAPSDSWRPSITSVSGPVSKAYTLTATQLNGLTNGGSFGDDMNMATDYPIVSLHDSTGHVYYATTFNFDQMAPRPGASGSCNFILAPETPNGLYTVHLSASGIESLNVYPILVAGEHVTQLAGSTSQDPGTAAWTVSLSAPAAGAGVVVNLASSNPSVATVPATVTVPRGATSVGFTLNVLGSGYTNVTAETARPHPSFKAVSRGFGWRVASLAGPILPDSGMTATWSVSIGNTSLENAAPSGGVTIALQSSNPAAATVPATVTVPAGAKSVSFPVTLGAGGKTSISASLPGSSMAALFGYGITFARPGVAPNADAPQTAGGFEPWGVYIDDHRTAPAGGVVVSLQSSDTTIATVPATVTIPQGLIGAQFAVTVGSNPAGNPATITASIPGTSVTGQFGYRIVSHQIAPLPVHVGSTSVGTIFLNGLAPPNGLVIRYINGSPANATIPAGQTMASGTKGGGYVILGVSPNPSCTVTAQIGTAGPSLGFGFAVAP
jgi:hypothetical protein